MIVTNILLLWILYHMLSSSVTCPVCGAKILPPRPGPGYICYFCKFERRRGPESDKKPIIYFKDIPYILEINNISEIYVEGVKESDLSHSDKKYPGKLIPLGHDHKEIGAIWSDMILPFQENLAEYFSRKFRQLAPGGLLYLSTPVRRRFQGTYPLPGQINFFTSKNIMFLLEQHGFKLIWRKNRFAPILRIIVRKDGFT